MKGLTRGQENVLTFFARYVDRHGRPPSLREIARHVGSPHTNTGNTYIEALIIKGMLTKADKVARGTRLTVEGRAYARQLEQRGQPG